MKWLVTKVTVTSIEMEADDHDGAIRQADKRTDWTLEQEEVTAVPLPENVST